MEQVQAFVQFRDQNLDHPLFGALANHRDLLVVTAPDGAGEEIDLQGEYMRANFRRTASVRAQAEDLASRDRFARLREAAGLQVCPVFVPEQFAQQLVGEDRAKAAVEQKLRLEASVLVLGTTVIPGFNAPPQPPDGQLADPPIDSGRQFGALFRDRHFVDLFARWLKVRARKQLQDRSLPDVRQQIERTRDCEDDAFLQRLYAFIYHRPRPEPRVRPPPNTSTRQNKRIRELFSVLPAGLRPTAMLDIGCSDGFVAEQFGEALHLSPENVVGLDIRPPISQKIRFVEGSGAQFMQELASAFDLITVSMTLHHIWNYKAVLQNCRKYLREGGVLFVREHDAHSNQYKLYLDCHDQAFNSALWQEPEADHGLFVANCRSWFLSKQELEEALQEAGFRALKTARDGGGQDWEVHGRVWYGTFS